MTGRLTWVSWGFLLVQAALGKGDVVGWVTHCSGHWEDRTNADHPVKLSCHGAREELWHDLSTESNLVRTSYGSKEWVDVRIAITGEKHHFDCDKPGECDPPPLPFAKFVPKETNEGLLQAFQAFLESPGKAYARIQLLLSKSENDDTGRVTVDHAVAEDGAKISLRDLVRPTVPPGEYLLELCPFDEKNGCPKGGKPVSMKWVPNSPLFWPHTLNTGLYEIVLDQVVSGLTMRTPDRGLLLVVPKGHADSVRAIVEAGERVFLKDWKDQSEGRLMFQALLVDLASREQ